MCAQRAGAFTWCPTSTGSSGGWSWGEPYLGVMPNAGVALVAYCAPWLLRCTDTAQSHQPALPGGVPLAPRTAAPERQVGAHMSASAPLHFGC